MARTNATLYAFGAAAGLLVTWDAAPGPRRWVLLALACLGLLSAAVVGRWGARWPRWTFHGTVGAATVLISAGVLVAPGPVVSLGAATLIAFVVIDAHFFFAQRPALLHTAAAVLGTSAALLLSGGVGAGVVLAFDLVLVGMGTVVRRIVRLASHASRDPLTGLHNRRGFDDALEELMVDAARTRAPLSAVLIDVDHFKAVNDTFGHDEGDRVLCRVADTWRGEVPAGAVLARHGGDEFSLLLPGLAGAEALALVRRVCALDPAVSLSCGVAEHRPGDSASQLMRSADRALYDAKELGRGRAELVGAPRDEAGTAPGR